MGGVCFAFCFVFRVVRDGAPPRPEVLFGDSEREAKILEKQKSFSARKKGDYRDSFS